MLTSRTFGLVLLALGGLVPAAVAGVIVVDPPTGPSAQAAIDAAAPGDILLLKPSASDPASDLLVDGKGLTLVADGRDIAFRKLRIQNVPAGQQFTARGLTIGSTDDGGQSLSAGIVQLCAGSVWFDACTIFSPLQHPGFLGSSPEGAPGVFVINSAAVLFTGCTI